MSKVAITGMGIISSIGNNVVENYQALLQAKNGISRIEHIETKHKETIHVGEIKITNETFIDKLHYGKDNSYSRTALLGIIAAQEALHNAGIKNIQSKRTGFISATTVGGMDQTERYYYDYLSAEKNRKFIVDYHAGESTKKIANYLGITDFVTTISTACSSAANAIMLGARMIKAGRLDRVIVGGTDCLSKFTINGFKTLMILSEEHCQPFDANRTGLNLGEAAAFLVLESAEIVEKETKKILAYLSGYGNANDAFHQTASSENGDGATLAMQKAIETAGITPNQISYVNAHGTATPNNDLSEGRALRRIFEEKFPPISSTKAFTGHTLAAAGAVEAVFSVLALQHQKVFPNLNFKTPIEGLGIIPVTKISTQPIEYVLSNSFGFGGNCSTLIFSKA